ncbi:signal recognition particle-docking protein FtsY [Streptococcus bovimastitidis]|uniref:Signal recognition particle receptor FtsY n=1 Tax=Streptococcus bovimastitidis TaxID=1856638 RepID=A0A1L8MPU9_9STRE|nr:signal recognition particle-docking protein FtsY [Streptococcus bovimastitidis]OJF72778.1 signal recognition particle-docking protein FtsY [Streptococcus bovimastitidis]
MGLFDKLFGSKKEDKKEELDLPELTEIEEDSPQDLESLENNEDTQVTEDDLFSSDIEQTESESLSDLDQKGLTESQEHNSLEDLERSQLTPLEEVSLDENKLNSESEEAVLEQNDSQQVDSEESGHFESVKDNSDQEISEGSGVLSSVEDETEELGNLESVNDVSEQLDNEQEGSDLVISEPMQFEPIDTDNEETGLAETNQDESDKVESSSYSVMEEYYLRKAAFEEQLRQGTFSNQETSNSDTENEVKQETDALASQVGESESDQEKYNRSLKKTRSGFASRLNAFFANFRSVDEEFFEELEEMLILSDVGVTVATRLTDELRQEAKLENAKKPEALRRVIIEKLVDIYEKDGVYNEKINYQNDLTVMLFVGVNGVGKTTSIGKLAYRYKAEGKKVMLVAADTFRAGAVAQLAEWGRRVDVPVVTGPEKADPASVVFDGVERAVAEGIDILLIDTAGRLQNKENLMAELEKMGRIIKRVIPDAPHETLLALDASTGQNALSQAKEFSKIMPLTGLILTKIDGSAKGGVVLAIRQELDIPVKFIGFGEKIDDIGEFDSEDFMKSLLGDLI